VCTCVDYTLRQPVKLAAQSPRKRLKLLLVDRDLQLEDLARATGLSVSLVEKIAAGHRRPTARTSTRIENFFGCRIFSTPARYRLGRKGRAAHASPGAIIEGRPVTIPTGCEIECGTEAEAIAAEKEFAGFIKRDGATISFTKPTPVIISEP
jgi:transcriptional regulator with XRE-family HTH domain